MEIVLDQKDLNAMPEALRESLIKYLLGASEIETDHGKAEISSFNEDSRVIVRSRVLSRGGARLRQETIMRDGEKCAVCGETENLELDHIVPFAEGGASVLENCQLLCPNHHRLKTKKERRLSQLWVEHISVEAALALFNGLSSGGQDILRLFTARNYSTEGLNPKVFMDAPELEGKIKDKRALNGAMSGITRRFRSLFQARFKASPPLLIKYDDHTEVYKLGEGAFYSIKAAIRYFDKNENYERADKIDPYSQHLYSMGRGEILDFFNLDEAPNGPSQPILQLSVNKVRSDSDQKHPTEIFEGKDSHRIWNSDSAN